MKKLLFACMLFAATTQAQTSKTIVSNIAAINGDTVTLENGVKFQVHDTGLYVGKLVTFTPTNISDRKNRRKVNAKKIEGSNNVLAVRTDR